MGASSARLEKSTNTIAMTGRNAPTGPTQLITAAAAAAASTGSAFVVLALCRTC